MSTHSVCLLFVFVYSFVLLLFVFVYSCVLLLLLFTRRWPEDCKDKRAMDMIWMKKERYNQCTIVVEFRIRT